MIFAVWPGLPGLIRHGRLPFLILTVGFGLLSAGVLFCCGYWTELISPRSKGWLLLGLGISWVILSLTAGHLSLHFDRQLAFDARGDRYLIALDLYLGARWSEAETVIRAILKRNRRDPEALLLLTALCRHGNRLDEAAETLERLERLESSEPWLYEISLERAALRRAQTAENAEESPENAPPENIPQEPDELAENEAVYAFESPRRLAAE